MSVPALFEASGSQAQKPSPWAPVFIESFFEGMYSNRAALHSPGSVVESIYYHGRPGSMLTGLNVECSIRNTIIRRYGTSAFSTALYSTPPNIVYPFELNDGTVRVIVDTSSTPLFSLTSVSTSSGGDAVYTGVITGGANNAYFGLDFDVEGFTNGANDGTFLCVASDATSLTLANPAAVSETIAATAISAGAVYWDQQNGQKTLLFAKSSGAGQTYFQNSGGILYMGDGVDVRKWTPLNPNLPPDSSVSVWRWGSDAPTTQPTVTIVSSGSASTLWQANTIFSTMGLTVDGYGQIWQLIGVNADGTNTPNAVFGTAGNGNPSWNQALYGQTTEGSGTPIVWQNLGQISPWQAKTQYGDAGVNGVAAPVAIYDSVSSSIYLNFNNSGGLGTSGTIKPAFNGSSGSSFWDSSCHWFFLGKFSQMQPWKASHGYIHWYTVGGVPGTHDLGNPVNSVIEPFLLPPPPDQPIYLQVPTNTGTSGASYAPFPANAGIGTQQPDAQLLWLSLGSGTWTPSTNYIQWQVQGTPFGCVYDGINMQVCSVSGLSDTTKPGTTAVITSCANTAGGNTVYTGTFPTSPAWTNGRPAAITGFTTNPGNNGTFTIVSSTATTLTVANPNGVAEVATAQAVFNPWATTYGQSTQDGSVASGAVTWVCVGPQVSWVAGSATTGIWHFPLTGYQPPQPSQSFGGSTIDSNTALVETSVVSGKSGTIQPTWGVLHTDIGDPSATLVLTSVAVVGTTTTYNGTITGGGSNAFAGSRFLIQGFTNSGNNGIILVTASTTTTLVCTTITQISETNAATAITGLVWYSESAVVANSLVWKTGHVYAYSFKARAFDDFYSPAPLGGGNIPPGSDFGALGPPTGSATNLVTSASPAFIITGANSGAVNTVTGLGSLDPQIDTIIIWRDADGGGIGQMFELTEIPAPKPISGVAQPWSFQDFLPDTATSEFPGLNTLIPAPINDVNDPPPATFLPMAVNFSRIWGSDSQFVEFSGGPDTLVGNPDEAFPPVNSIPYLADVIKLIRTTQGMVVFTTEDINIIAGGPLTSSFFSVVLVPGVGLLNFNAAEIFSAEIFFLSSNRQLRLLNPALSLTTVGIAVADQIKLFDPATAYLTVLDGTNPDTLAIYLGTGSSPVNGVTGWLRLNPRQSPGLSAPEPVWSPFAAITGGCQMLKSVQVSPGISQLLIGSVSGNSNINRRDTSIFTDNVSGVATSYGANFTIGSLLLARRGETCLLKALEADFAGVASQPMVSFLLDEISGSFTNFVTSKAQYDPPWLYGTTVTPTSYTPLRFYFLSTASVAKCVHGQFHIDFGTNSNADEIFNLTLIGRIVKAQ